MGNGKSFITYLFVAVQFWANAQSTFISITRNTVPYEVYDLLDNELLVAIPVGENYSMQLENDGYKRTLLFMPPDFKFFYVIVNQDSLNIHNYSKDSITFSSQETQNYFSFAKKVRKAQSPNEANKLAYSYHLTHPNLLASLHFLHQTALGNVFSKDSLLNLYYAIDKSLQKYPYYTEVGKLLLEKPAFNITMNTSQYTLYYNTNQHVFNTEQKEALHQFINSFKNNLDSVFVESYCDDVGSQNYNAVLAQKRNLSTLGFLKSSCSSQIKTAAQAVGEIALDANNQDIDAQRKENRKTSIYFFMKTSLKNTTKDSLAIGQKWVLKNIEFEPGNNHILPKSTESLYELLDYVKSNNHTFQLQGHVCCYNKNTELLNQLSESRAKTIYDFLIKNGVDAGRLSYIGLGLNFPLNNNSNDPANRRVELVRVK